MASVCIPVHSLVSLCIDHVGKNFSKYIDCGIQFLPPRIKNRMLRKFTSSSYYWTNVNFKNALSTLVHADTKKVDLSLADIDDDILNILSECQNLLEIHFTKYKEQCITHKGLIHFVTSFENLYSLQFSDCMMVNDDVIANLVKVSRKLTALDLNKCENVTDVGIAHLATLENLIWLTLSSTQWHMFHSLLFLSFLLTFLKRPVGALVCIIISLGSPYQTLVGNQPRVGIAATNEGIEVLANGPSGSKMKELRLANCKNITSAVLKVIANMCPKIEILVFYNMQFNDCDEDTCFLLQDKNLKNLKQLTWTVQL